MAWIPDWSPLLDCIDEVQKDFYIPTSLDLDLDMVLSIVNPRP